MEKLFPQKTVDGVRQLIERTGAQSSKLYYKDLFTALVQVTGGKPPQKTEWLRAAREGGS